MQTAPKTRDLGITYTHDDGSTERTVIATIVRDEITVTGAVLLNGDMHVIDSPEAFTVEGVDNWELAANVAANEHGRNSSWAALVGIDLCEAAQQVLA